MSVFGVGGWELLLVFLIMLMVAGPKRMAQWAYQMGKYIAKFRKMWEEVVDVLQDELDEAGVGIQLPKDVPTKQNINKMAKDALKPVSNPLEESMKDVEKDIGEVREASKVGTTSMNVLSTKKDKPKPAASATKPEKPKEPASESNGQTKTASKSDDKAAPTAESPAPAEKSTQSSSELGTWGGGS